MCIPAVDNLDDLDWVEIIKYLSLLRHFVEATTHLEGNMQADGNHVSCGAI